MSMNLLNISIIVAIVGSGFGLILLGIIFVLRKPSAVEERMRMFAPSTGIDNQRKSGSQQGVLNKFRNKLNNLLTVFSSVELQKRIASAYWQITDIEFIFIRIIATIIGFGIGWLIPRNIIGGIGLAVVVYLLPGMFLNRSAYNRRKIFQDQLIDVLVLIKGAVQSGYSLLQSLEIVIEEMAPPASDEFNRVVREVQLGLPLSRALQNLSTRMESDDLKLVVTAIIINSEVGGNLSTMLTAVTNTIRNRIYMFGEIRASTSYARYTSYFLTFLPVITAVLMFLVNPTYFTSAWDSPITKIMFVMAFISMVIGNIILRRIVKVDV